MSSAFAALRVGDPLMFDGAEYLAVGMLRLRTADGDEWCEWLLTPRRSLPVDAVRDRRHRWISRESGRGLQLWSPTDLPDGFTLEALDTQRRFRHLGRDYRVEERYAMTVAEIVGDVGGDATRGESFEAVDLQGGNQWLSVEWNARGADATVGRNIGNHDLLRWSRDAGGGLATRANGPGRVPSGRMKPGTTPLFGDGGLKNGVSILAFGLIAVLAVALESCDGDDCSRRYNTATNQYETVCSDGMRGSGGRSFGGWGGK